MRTTTSCVERLLACLLCMATSINLRGCSVQYRCTSPIIPNHHRSLIRCILSEQAAGSEHSCPPPPLRTLSHLNKMNCMFDWTTACAKNMSTGTSSQSPLSPSRLCPHRRCSRAGAVFLEQHRGMQPVLIAQNYMVPATIPVEHVRPLMNIHPRPVRSVVHRVIGE